LAQAFWLKAFELFLFPTGELPRAMASYAGPSGRAMAGPCAAEVIVGLPSFGFAMLGFGHETGELRLTFAHNTFGILSERMNIFAQHTLFEHVHVEKESSVSIQAEKMMRIAYEWECNRDVMVSLKVVPPGLNFHPSNYENGFAIPGRTESLQESEVASLMRESERLLNSAPPSPVLRPPAELCSAPPSGRAMAGPCAARVVVGTPSFRFALLGFGHETGEELELHFAPGGLRMRSKRMRFYASPNLFQEWHVEKPSSVYIQAEEVEHVAGVWGNSPDAIVTLKVVAPGLNFHPSNYQSGFAIPGRTERLLESAMPSLVPSSAPQSGRARSRSRSRHSSERVSCYRRGGALRFLTREERSALQDEIVSPARGHCSGSLREIAALTYATATCDTYPVKKYPRVLCVIGPGDNGVHGLIMAGHLHHFGYEVEVYINHGVNSDQAPFADLVLQLEQLNVGFTTYYEQEMQAGKYKLVIDAIFGFNDVKENYFYFPFDQLIFKLCRNCVENKVPIVSIDFPSGWDCDRGDEESKGPSNLSGYLKPDCLISLIAPVQGARRFSGRHHFLGGRFVPKSIDHQFALNLPPYQKSRLYTRISHEGSAAGSASG